MKKRLLSLMLVVLNCMMIWSANGDTFIRVTSEGVALKYKVTDETKKECMVGTEKHSLGLACETSTTGTVTIPSNVNGYSVTSIGYGAFDQCRISGISIPNTVRSIYGRAFNDCAYLNSIYIPSSVTDIAVGSGSGGAFSPIFLTNIVVADGNSTYDSRNGCNAIIKKTTGTLIYGCDNTIIPNDIKQIGAWAFSKCNGLTNIIIPDGILRIGESAFRYCNNLVSVTIPESVTRIDSYAFAACSKLSDIDMPQSITNLGTSAFDGTEWEKNLPEGLKYIGKIAYKYVGEMPENTSIEIKDGTTSICGNAFLRGGNLISISIPNSVTSIGEFAFMYCGKLSSITIPSNVTSIGQGAFWSCYTLSSVVAKRSTPINIYNVFSDVDKITLYVPYGSKELYENDYYWKQFKEIKEIENIFTDTTEFGIQMTFMVTDEKNKTCQVGDGTHDAVSLKNGDDCITIPSYAKGYKVTSISNYAFANIDDDDVTELEIPNTVNYIGVSAFSGFEDLRDIYIRDLEAWLKINFDGSFSNPMFGKCRLNLIKDTDVSPVTSVVVPQSITAINAYVFYGCSSLTSITIHDKVSSIGTSAFYNCTNLRKVTVLNTTPIPISSSVFSNMNQIVLYVPVGSKATYETADYWKEFKEIKEMGDDIAIGSVGMATYCSTHGLNFSGTDDIKAYIVSAFKPGTGEVTLTRITDVPANTGIIVKGDADTYSIPWGTGETIVTNMLVGVTTNTVLNKVDGEYTNYILAKKNGNLGFYAVADGTTLSAGKAYLPLPTASLPSGTGAREVQFIFDDEKTTDITEIESMNDARGVIYNLQGRRVINPTKGLYFINGKKIIIK